MTTDIDAILAERGSRYGVFKDHATISQALKDTMRGKTGFAVNETELCKSLGEAFELRLAPDQIEALDMIAHKIARILNGDPDYADSWDDIAGYAKLVGDRLTGVSR
jgi:hypothetical protein